MGTSRNQRLDQLRMALTPLGKYFLYEGDDEAEARLMRSLVGKIWYARLAGETSESLAEEMDLSLAKVKTTEKLFAERIGAASELDQCMARERDLCGVLPSFMVDEALSACLADHGIQSWEAFVSSREELVRRSQLVQSNTSRNAPTPRPLFVDELSSPRQCFITHLEKLRHLIAQQLGSDSATGIRCRNALMLLSGAFQVLDGLLTVKCRIAEAGLMMKQSSGYYMVSLQTLAVYCPEFGWAQARDHIDRLASLGLIQLQTQDTSVDSDYAIVFNDKALQLAARLPFNDTDRLRATVVLDSAPEFPLEPQFAVRDFWLRVNRGNVFKARTKQDMSADTLDRSTLKSIREESRCVQVVAHVSPALGLELANGVVRSKWALDLLRRVRLRVQPMAKIEVFISDNCSSDEDSHVWLKMYTAMDGDKSWVTKARASSSSESVDAVS